MYQLLYDELLFKNKVYGHCLPDRPNAKQDTYFIKKVFILKNR